VLPAVVGVAAGGAGDSGRSSTEDSYPWMRSIGAALQRCITTGHVKSGNLVGE